VSTVPAETDSYQKIIETNKDKSKGFASTMQWITSSFPSSKAVIEYSDAQAGTIMGNILFDVSLGALDGPSLVKCLLSFEIKDNKVRITFSKIKRDYSKMGNSGGDQLAKSILESEALTQSDYDKITAELDNIIANYVSFISKNSTDW
jgi:hypothetical protein